MLSLTYVGPALLKINDDQLKKNHSSSLITSSELMRSSSTAARRHRKNNLVDQDEEYNAGSSVSNDGTQFKALKLKGFQALERTQEPALRFPGTLASYVLVFAMDDEWVKWAQGDTPTVSYALLTAQPLLDKMRSADMIVRVFTDDKRKKCFALVSVSEKRQKMVAQIMGPLIRLRLKRNDDEGNVIVNGGAWSDFKQHLASLYERSSEGTLFSSCQQCQIIEFLLNDVDEHALGPQLMQKVRTTALCHTSSSLSRVVARVVGGRVIARLRSTSAATCAFLPIKL